MLDKRGRLMLKAGLVSVTFRNLQPKKIIALVNKAGLDAIEWGGDIHVPHGNIATAKKVCRMTLDAGLISASYGSYYKVGVSEIKGLSFNSVLDAAVELRVPTIRVWAGDKGSAEADKAYRAAVVEDARRIADLAGKAGATISFEYHRKTLTDTDESARTLLKEIDHKNIFTYWQPPLLGEGFNERIFGLKAISSRLSNLHVFYCVETNGQITHRPLKEGEKEWLLYLDVVKKTDKRHFALIEFVKDGSVEQFLEDAKTLKSWINNKT